MKTLRVLTVCLLCVLLSASCAMSQQELNGIGVLLDEDVLASIMNEIQEKENSLLAEDGEVFWTPSGKIWHATHECSYLSSSKEIYHGTVDEAMLAGKERACDRCFASDRDRTYSELEGKPIEEGDVFFTQEGENWHFDINCPRITGAEYVYNASEEKAKELGKTDACDECNDR